VRYSGTVERRLDKVPLSAVKAAIGHRDTVTEKRSKSVEQGAFLEFAALGDQNLMNQCGAGHDVRR
jgi:hypothetical protein